MSTPDAPFEIPAPLESPEAHLDGLGERFLLALAAREKGDVDEAAEALRAILRIEPRLPEPQMELARLLLEAGQLDEAEERAREAIQLLESGGQWTDDVPEPVVQSLAWDLLGEILRTQADQDEVVFGDPDAWKALIGEARDAFKRAAALDPDNEHAVHAAFGFDPGDAVERDEPEADEPAPAEG